MPAVSKTQAPRSYAELKRGVEDALLAGQRRVEQAKVLTYFETGRLINEHVRVAGSRADYGSQVLDRLARDLEIAKTTLYQCTQFARYFADTSIFRHGGKLGWAHYRLLCQVDDAAQRTALLSQTLKNDWTSPELQERVRTFNATSAETSAGTNGNNDARPPSPPKLLTAKHGTPGLYPIIARHDALAVDLGFKLYRPLDKCAASLRLSKAGDIVRVDDAGEFSRAADATKADLFTYRALHVRVVDGDTLAVTIDLPPHHQIDKKLRLRGLNTPEMDTAAGKAAKRFVQHLVDSAAAITLTTTKPDKYDRYLADVFLSSASGSQPSALDSQLVFLNNALLENGHAHRMETVPPAELL